MNILNSSNNLSSTNFVCINYYKLIKNVDTQVYNNKSETANNKG
jgi:hypothetical protein